MLRADQLDVARACVLVIDMQEKLLPLIHGHDQIIAATTALLRGAAIFELPIITTQQYPQGIGPTVPAIESALEPCNNRTIDKVTFSACGEERFRTLMREIDRPQVIIAGIETHVCVQQTALDLRTQDYDVFVCADATGSRQRLDFECALDRMRQAHIAVTTVESVLFELCNRCDTTQFKSMLDIIKGNALNVG